MRVGKIIGGIILIILGIVTYGGSSTLYTTTSQHVEECNSIISQLGQSLDQQTVEACNNALGGQSISNIFIFIGIIITIIGIALVIIGSVQQSKKKKERQLMTMITKAQ